MTAEEDADFADFFDTAHRPGRPTSLLLNFHRLLGRGVYSMDVDNVEIGSGDRGVIYAADYKGPRESAEPSWHLTKLVDVFTVAGKPFFIIKWESLPEWSFTFHPLNQPARDFLGGQDGVVLTAAEYAEMMFIIRGRAMPDAVRRRIERWEAGDRDFGWGSQTWANVV